MLVWTFKEEEIVGLRFDEADEVADLPALFCTFDDQMISLPAFVALLVLLTIR